MSSENGWIPWNERNDIPKRAFLIGWEVIPMPPVPDEYLEDFKNSINQSLIGKSRCWFGREDYNSNDSFKIVLYNQLSRDEQIAFSAYETSSFYYPNQTNIDYLRSVAVTIEKLAQNDFEDKLKTSACQDSASAPNSGDSPAAPASTPADSNSPVAFFVPEFDGSDDWVSIDDVAVMMVEAEQSIDIDSAKKNIHNQKSNGKKSSIEKYDGIHSACGESIHGKWRVILKGGKPCIMFYKPSLKIRQGKK